MSVTGSNMPSDELSDDAQGVSSPIIFQSDEIEVGIRKSDNSRWIKFYLGEQDTNRMVWAGVSTQIGDNVLYNISIKTERY